VNNKELIPPGLTYLADNIISKNNILGASRGTRAKWAKDLSFPEETETIFFAGCGYQYASELESLMSLLRRIDKSAISTEMAMSLASFQKRLGIDASGIYRRVMARGSDGAQPLLSAVKVLRNLGVKFGYLGDDEPCCGALLHYTGLHKKFAQHAQQVHDTLKSRGLDVPMITTSITDANQSHASDVFRTASDCGIKYIKLGYWDYGGFGMAKEQIRKMQNDLNGIFKLCEEYDVNAAVHIHSGNCLSSSAVLLWMLLRDYDPTHLGAYIDPGHMAVEGGLTGWRMGMDLLRENTRIVAVKDFGWFKGSHEAGRKGWRAEIVPLSEGLVPWVEVFQYLREMGFDGPVSLHSEYEYLDLKGLIHQTKSDLEYIRDILNKL